MKAFIIVFGTVCLLLTIAISAIRGSSSEEQNKKETLTQGEKLDALAGLTDLFVTIVSEDGKVTKTEMKKLRKVVAQYKDVPLYKQLNKKFDTETIPPLYLLTTVEHISVLYFPSLGRTCEKECLERVRFLFNQLGADVKTVEPNTGPRDILIGAVVGFAAIIIFVYWLFRQFSLLGKLKERLDKENTPP